MIMQFLYRLHTMHSDPVTNDFCLVVELKKERVLADHEKYYLLKNHFRPNSSYHFPSILYGSRHRSFQHSWLSQYNGLVYSETKQGGYCKYCVLFGQAPHSVYRFSGTLETQPLCNFQKASEKLREHFLGIGNSSPRAYH